MKKIAIFLNGEYSSNLQKIKEYVGDRDIIAVDGGLNKVYELNLIPKKIIGDMDSVKKEILYYFLDKNIEIISLEKEKDYTDFEVALLNYIPGSTGRFENNEIKENFKHLDDVDILVLGSSGKRLDMTLSNLKKMHNVKNMKFLTNNFEIVEYINKSKKFLNLKSYIFSIIPVENIESLSLYGFKYKLENKNINIDIGLVSNEVIDNTCSIEFKKGSMYIIYRDSNIKI